MLRFFSFLGRHKKVVVLAGAISLSSWMLSLGEHEKFKMATAVSTSILQVGQRGFSWSIRLVHLQREHEELRRKAAELSLEISQLREAKEENERLRELLEFEERSHFELLPAKVIGWGTDRTVNSIVINVGQRKGVEKNMPVITPAGLVGKVYRAMPFVSVVQLLLDPNCRVSALVQRSRTSGILGWERGDRCFLNNVPIRGDVREGDVLVTSGMGGVFPKGLLLGHVSQISGDEWRLFKEIRVIPAVDFARLEEVFVLIYEDLEKSSADGRGAVDTIDAR
ncbi:MAG: rod shape-determining protein MreC [Gemmatimonadota bacterium]|nr:MAG: rod shape-determining protein MreC [Gemmatimonadota bacterium]